MLRNQKGFALIELAILALVAVLIILAGSYARHHYSLTKKVNGPTKTSAVSPNPKTISQPVVPAGWLTYKSTHTSIQFFYPPSWKLTYGQTTGTTLENVTITGTADFSVQLFLEKQHPPAPQNYMCTFPQTQKIIALLNNDYAMVLDGTKGVFLQDVNAKNLISGSCGYKLNIADSDSDFTFYGAYPVGTHQGQTADTYVKLPEVETAKTVFSTFTK